MSKLKAGIIGCGGIALGKHLPSIKQTQCVQMVAFCDIDKEKALKACKEYGDSTAKVYEDYRKLIEDETIEVIYVCTPNRSHCEITVAALEAGKHVMCEKPMAINSAEAKLMVASAKKSGKLLTIGYQNRFREDSQYLKKVCESDELGEIYMAKARALRRRAVPTWGVFLNKEEQGGGPLIDIGTHALDLTLWMMNNYKPKYAVGTTYHKLNDQKNTANAWGDWNCEEFTVEDSAFGFVVMQNGATIILESSWALNTLENLEAATLICGTKGGADMFDGLRINGVNNNTLFVTKPEFCGNGVDFYDEKGQKPEVAEQMAFINAILGKGELTVLPEQALVVTQILEAIYQSAETGKPVYFED